MYNYDVIVIGAGPTGLSFGSRFKGKFMIFDMGNPISKRDHDDSIDSLIGAGGAGLFSDGKYSFYPAGTKIWDLTGIEYSYESLSNDIKKYIPDIPDFTKKSIINQNNKDSGYFDWKLKKYPCYYVPLDKRKEMINDLCSKIPEESLKFRHQVMSYQKISTGYIICVKNLITGKIFDVRTKIIICAGGRFFPLYMNSININTNKIFRRIEYGVRVIGNVNNKTMKIANNDLLDPKFIKTKGDIEYRTFCWCIDAETVLTNHLGIKTYSGRADCPSTGISNFGFNTRIKKESKDVEKYVNKLKSIKPFEIPIKDVDKIVDYYGKGLGKPLINGLKSLLEEHPDLKDTKLQGPTIEGVGYYPDIDSNLKIKGENIYCGGDNSGIFRGIIASMLSGYWLSTHIKIN